VTNTSRMINWDKQGNWDVSNTSVGGGLKNVPSSKRQKKGWGSKNGKPKTKRRCMVGWEPLQSRTLFVTPLFKQISVKLCRGV